MRVAVFGAGYAGLTVARRLERSLPDDVELVVVDESDTHLVLHELHRVVRRPALADAITVPLEDVLPRASVRQATVTDIDTDRNVATLSPLEDDATEELHYDLAAVCLGSRTEFYDLPGVEAHATPLKRLDHASEIRGGALSAPDGRVVVGGAGLSGIQVAGELAALSRERDLALTVTLLEMAERVAPGFDEVFAAALRRELDARDVVVETGATVTSADDEAVSLDGGRSLPYDAFVWTGGIRGPDALDGERAPVGEDLRVDGDTFVLGDAGTVTDTEGVTAPPTAQTAVRQARIVAANVGRLAMDADVELERYTYDSPGWVVSVGDGAVARLGPVVVSGETARAAKAAIGAGHLGSVCAIEETSELVREELGWPGIDAVDVPLRVLAEAGERGGGLETDPATLSEYESLVEGVFAPFADPFVPGDPVDLTTVTRLTDREHPGSPANLLQRAVLGTLETAAALGTPKPRRADVDDVEADREDSAAHEATDGEDAQ